MTTLETVKIDLDSITCSEAWLLIKAYENKEIDINTNTLLSSKLAVILSETPENIVTSIVNGYTVETTDCYKRHYLRVLELNKEWHCFADINSYNCQMSWEPEYIELINNDEIYIINVFSLQIYKLTVKN